jgi:hypothetical protein
MLLASDLSTTETLLDPSLTCRGDCVHFLSFEIELSELGVMIWPWVTVSV